MSEMERRGFLKALGAATALGTFPASIRRALAIPANTVTGTIMDVQHVVILMQENRAFDHYFGTLQGVRGFNDPRAVTLANGNPVWYQPNGSSYVLPFHPTTLASASNTLATDTTVPPNMGITFIQDLDHGWQSTHEAWNNGQWDQWVTAKARNTADTGLTMAYLTRDDIPYHYALADAFTVCDAYHCSLMGPTDPNRYHMWTGWVGNDGNGGGPVVDNAEQGYSWHTYPEKLQANGITWKVYQDAGNATASTDLTGPDWGWTGNPYIGNYGDNSLLYFFQYQNAPAHSPLAKLGRTGTNIATGGTLFDQFAADVASGKLPQVSYIVAPEAYCEHPNWIPNWGAWYISQMLDILTANPDVWASTVFLITYDENDGFFDHMVAPTPPMSAAQGLSTVGTKNEIFDGTESPNVPAYTETGYTPGPYGLGARVPMIVISPWSKGGYVNSQVFDHTSIIRFLEQRFGQDNPRLIEHNITPWRRTVSGDLTSCFNFASPNAVVVPALPAGAAFDPPAPDLVAAGTRFADYVAMVPPAQAMPQQESGIKPAKALPYQPLVTAHTSQENSLFKLTFGNQGAAGSPGIVYHVRQGGGAAGPWSFTIAPSHSASHTWTLGTAGTTSVYNLSVHGPNGFFRGFQGSVLKHATNLSVTTLYLPSSSALQTTIANLRNVEIEVQVVDNYTGKATTATIAAGASANLTTDLSATHNWYDLVVTVVGDSVFMQQLAGHIENGMDSYTDPAMGNPAN